MSPDFNEWRNDLKKQVLKNRSNYITFFTNDFPIVDYLNNISFKDFVRQNYKRVKNNKMLYQYVDWNCPTLTKEVINVIKIIELENISKHSIFKRLYFKLLYNKKARLLTRTGSNLKNCLM